MIIEPLALDEVYCLTPEPSWDSRGFFARCFSRAILAEKGLCTDFPEWSLSYNARRGTLRGLHWQAAPDLEVKLVQCVRGAVFDVAVDMRPSSSAFGKWIALELSAENRRTAYIPAGFAHGFQTLTDDTELLYHISQPFRPESARGVRWNDRDLAIAWPPASERILSERDASLPFLADPAVHRTVS
jgi:dTDP-4-dehydrorhamnose 3,5-epimerase